MVYTCRVGALCDRGRFLAPLIFSEPGVQTGATGMRLSKLGYYGDFVFYPVTVTALAGAALWTTTFESWPQWFVAFVGGFAAWTLIEYVLHRYVLHHVPYVKDMHDAHHADQMALIGTP